MSVFKWLRGRVAWQGLRALLLLGLALPGPHVQAQEPPKGVIRILVPLAVGSTSDVVARLIADNLSHLWGASVIVDNRAGGSGRVAGSALKAAAADGTTLLLAPIAVTVLNPLLYAPLNYDPVKDFAPVAQVARYTMALAVGPAVPATTLAEFVAWARLHPTLANFGSAGVGGLGHLFGEQIARTGGVELAHVPYTGGPRMTSDMIGGQLAAAIEATSNLIGPHRAGSIRIIAISGSERSPALPGVQTFAEQGFPALDSKGWLAVHAPARTPKPVVDQISRAIIDAVRTREVSERLIGLGLEPTGTTPEALATIMANDTARLAPMVKASGLSVVTGSDPSR